MWPHATWYHLASKASLHLLCPMILSRSSAAPVTLEQYRPLQREQEGIFLEVPAVSTSTQTTQDWRTHLPPPRLQRTAAKGEQSQSGRTTAQGRDIHAELPWNCLTKPGSDASILLLLKGRMLKAKKDDDVDLPGHFLLSHISLLEWIYQSYAYPTIIFRIYRT